MIVSAARDRRITRGNVLWGWIDALRIRVKALARSGTA